MSFLDPEPDFRGDGNLYRYLALDLQPALPFETPIGQDHPLYANNFYQLGFAWLPVVEENIDAENFHVELNQELELANPQPYHPAILAIPNNASILAQEQEPLYADNFYQPAFAWPPVVGPQENIDAENFQAELNRELELANPQPYHPAILAIPNNAPILAQGQEPLYVGNFYQPAFAWPPVVGPQENIDAENFQAEPNQELEPANHQPCYPAIPVIPNNAAYGIGNRPDQEFCCGNKCRSVFAGPHKCSYHGRSLKITCHGDDENCLSEFLKRNDFNRHCNTVHRGAGGAPAKELWSCPFIGCGRVGEKGFKREDNLTQHRRKVHKEKIEKKVVRFGRNNGAV